MTMLRSIAILTLSITLLGVPALGAETAATVEAVDWVTVADASIFEDGYLIDVAFAPGGATVIVGASGDLGGGRGARLVQPGRCSLAHEPVARRRRCDSHPRHLDG